VPAVLQVTCAAAASGADDSRKRKAQPTEESNDRKVKAAVAQQQQPLVNPEPANASQGTLARLLVEPSWQQALGSEMAKPYFTRLSDFVDKEYRNGTVYPPRDLVLRALNACPLDQVSMFPP
jgi:hypothetical protein